MDVELRHLRALVAIGDSRTITEAAAALHMSQPALSRTLEQLERRLGTSLVERTTRHLALTQPGQRLWEHAHRILNQVDEALTDATSAGRRHLRVGFPWAALGRHTVPLLRAWHEKHPDTVLDVRRCDDPEASTRRGQVDVAFLRTRPPDDLECLSLFSEPRVAAVPDGDALADRPDLSLSDLAHRTVALCTIASTTAVDLWPSGHRPRVLDVPGVDEWLTMIATGATVGVTTQATEHSHPHPGVRYLPLRDAPPVEVHLIWPAVPSHPATADFVNHTRRQAAPDTTTSG